MLEADRHLGRVYRVEGRTKQAVRILSQNLDQWKILGRRQGIINCLRDLGIAQYCDGDVRAAYEIFRMALKTQRLTGSDRYGRIKILWWLRRLASAAGNKKTAAHYERSLQSFLRGHRSLLNEWRGMLRDLELYSGSLS